MCYFNINAIEAMFPCNFLFSMNDKLDPEMMGRTNPGMKGGLKNGVGGNINGNGHHHPLPPDGMYHVSDGNGHGLNGFNGSMSNGMDNSNALAAALTDKVRMQLQQQLDEDEEDLLPPPPPPQCLQQHMPPGAAASMQRSSVVLNNKTGAPQMMVQNNFIQGSTAGPNKNNLDQDNAQMNSINLPGRLPPSTCV